MAMACRIGAACLAPSSPLAACSALWFSSAFTLAMALVTRSFSSTALTEASRRTSAGSSSGGAIRMTLPTATPRPMPTPLIIMRDSLS